jgi:uncharacterized membrane protein
MMRKKPNPHSLTLNSAKPLVLALMLGPAASLSANAYTLIDLGPNVAPKAISNMGIIVGSNTDQNPSTAFSWSSDGGFELIKEGTNANAVNDNGLIAGNTIDGAFIGDRDWSDYAAFGVNQTGEVAGYKVGKNPYRRRSLPYNPAIFNGKKWEIFDIARIYSRGRRKGVYADRYILNAINTNGYTVGFKYRYGLHGSSAILIDTNKPVNNALDVVFLSTPAGGRAVDINDLNKIVGVTGSNLRTTPVTYSRAFNYDFDTDNMTILPVLEGGLRSSASDINENSQVVGSSESVAGNHAVIWDETGSIVDLNDAITVSGWVVTSATAINDNGDIVGIGTLDGVNHGFLLNND